MKKLYLSLCLAGIFFGEATSALAFGTRGHWVASGGLGLTVGPTLLMLNPQLEYVQQSNLMIGPMIQMGVGEVLLFTGTATGRYLLGDHPKVKPHVEAGLGMAFGSSFFSSAVGVHVLLGMGVDFLIEKNISIGTVVRANFAPPLKSFFASWPLIIGRFAL